MPRTDGETKQRQFRLNDEALADLDAIAKYLTASTGIAHSRTDAVRYAARQTAEKISKKIPKNSST